jgi:soluble lytic murein transglycosylase-like protein
MNIFLVISGLLILGYFLLFRSPKLAEAKTQTALDMMIANASAKFGVETALIKAIIRQESNFNPNAINPSDPSYGYMQVGLMVAQDFGLIKDYQNPTGVEIALLLDPQTNINIGTWQLHRLLSKYPFEVAIQMYNVGIQGYNSGYRAAGYLANVTRFYNEYRTQD